MTRVLLFCALAALTGWYGGHAADNDTALHARQGLPHFFQKLHSSDTVVIAYLGGSITGAQGYRVQTEQWFRQQYPHTHFKTINAGVGGTGSDLGVFRLQEDVLQYNPDLVFVEFAVNDGSDSLKIGNAMEGIVRQIKQHNAGTGICFLYTISAPMVKKLQQGIQPPSVRFTEIIAAHYGLPSINLGVDVMAQLEKGTLVFHGQKGTDYGNKTVFTNDGVHPGTAGHQLYTATITRAFREMEHMKAPAKSKLPLPLYAGNFSQTGTYSPRIFPHTGGWKSAAHMQEISGWLKAMPDLMYTDNPNDSLTVRFKGTVIGAQDIIGPPSARVLIRVDGKQTISKLRFDQHGSWYRRSFYFLDPLPEGVHTVVFKLDTTPVNKTKIVIPAELGDTAKYRPSYLYIGKIMMAGKPINNE